MLRRILSLFASFAGASALVLSSGDALASPIFPDAIAETVGAGSNVPVCTICHASLSGGIGTVVKPFGQYMQSRGLTFGNTDSLKAALQAMIGEKHDTDGDGIPDVDELKAGTDPNGASNSDVEPIAYGCGRVAPRPPLDGAAFFAALVVMVALVRRPRGRRRH
jgi:hypothetical protein